MAPHSTLDSASVKTARVDLTLAESLLERLAVKNYAVIEGLDAPLELTPLDVIRLAASVAGFEDVDVEPVDNDRVRVKAHRRDGSSQSIAGRDLEAVSQKFVRTVLTLAES